MVETNVNVNESKTVDFELSDNWSIAGTDLGEYETLIGNITEATSFLKVKSDEFTAYYNLKHPAIRDAYKLAEISRTSIDLFNVGMEDYRVTSSEKPVLPMSIMAKKKVNEKLADESFDAVGFILAVNNRALYVAEASKKTLCMRAKLAGEKLVRNTLVSTMDIVEGLSTYKQGITMITRTKRNPETGINESKVFAFLTDKYVDIPLQVLPKVVRTIMRDGLFGTADVKGWYMDHQFTMCHIEFPEAGEDFATLYGLTTQVIPGLILMSSDTGSSSLIIRGTYRIKGASKYIVCDEYSHKHTGAITVEDVLQECDDKIMGNFRKLPEALADKLTRVIGEGKVDTPENRKKNKASVEKAMKSAFRALGLKKDIGTNRAKELLEQLAASIDDSVVYTEYDLAMLFLGLSDRIEGLSRELQERVARDCGKAPFIDYNTKKNSRKEDEEELEELVLLPEM